MFLMNHALVVDMLVEVSDTPSFAIIVGVRGSNVEKHITTAMKTSITTATDPSPKMLQLAAQDGSSSIVEWVRRRDIDIMSQALHKSFSVAGVMLQVLEHKWQFASYCAGFHGHSNLVRTLSTTNRVSWVDVVRGACCGGWCDIVDLLPEYYTHSTIREDMYIACQHGHVELFGMMLGKVHNMLDEYHFRRWLENAARHNHLPIIKTILVVHGSPGLDTALKIACEKGHRDAVEILIERGGLICHNCNWTISSGKAHHVEVA